MRTGVVCPIVQWGMVAIGWLANGQSTEPRDEVIRRWFSQVKHAQQLRFQGEYATSLQVLRDAVVLSRTVPDAPELKAQTYEYMGSTTAALGHPMEAEAHYLAAIQVWESMGPAVLVPKLRSQVDLVSLYVESGQMGKADRLARSLAKESEGKFLPGSGDASRLDAALGAVAYLHNQLPKAEALTRRAIRGKEVNSDTLPEELSQAHNGLALILWKDGRKREARQHARIAVEVLEKAGRTRCLELAAALSNLAMMTGEDGHDAQALTLMRRAVDMVRDSVGQDNGFLADLLTNYADLLNAARKKSESKQARREADAVYQRSLVARPERHTVDMADMLRDGKRR